MRWFAAAVGVMVVGGLVLTMLGAVGCVSQEQYEALMMKNREQDKLLQEKEATLAKLNERVEALTAGGTVAQKMLDDKVRELNDVKAEREKLHKAFEDLSAAYLKLVERGPAAGGGAIPEKTLLEIEKLANDYPGLFTIDRANNRLRFNSDITFDSGSNVVKPDAKAALTKLGQILDQPEARGIIVTVIGHTDSDRVAKKATIDLLKGLGKSPDNMGLSEARAESVAEVFKAGGMEGGRVVTQGKGQTDPIADNKTADGKAKNRRVEIYLTPGAAPSTAPAAPVPAMEKPAR
jgi:flagellar motor protein MotB